MSWGVSSEPILTFKPATPKKMGVKMPSETVMSFWWTSSGRRGIWPKRTPMTNAPSTASRFSPWLMAPHRNVMTTTRVTSRSALITSS
jgi:hypothetical protein